MEGAKANLCRNDNDYTCYLHHHGVEDMLNCTSCFDFFSHNMTDESDVDDKETRIYSGYEDNDDIKVQELDDDIKKICEGLNEDFKYKCNECKEAFLGYKKKGYCLLVDELKSLKELFNFYCIKIEPNDVIDNFKKDRYKCSSCSLPLFFDKK